MYVPSPILSPLLFLPGLLFEGLVRARNSLYDAGLLVPERLQAPVLSVGNLTLGGTGKTPLAIYLAGVVGGLGFTPVLLSRGYRRQVQTPVIVPPDESLSIPFRLTGDEPALARRRVPGLWLGISKNRYAMGMHITKQVSRPAFILDDGFQHRGLARDIDLVVIDSTQALAGNRIVPRGTLREPLSALRRSDLIVINGSSGSQGPDAAETLVRGAHPRGVIVHCRQHIESLIPFDSWQDGGTSLPPAVPGTAFLAAGLGNPDRFRRDVQALGIKVAGCRFFGDHFVPDGSDWLACAAEARRVHAEVVITTEKDAVKIIHAPDYPFLVAVQSTVLAEAAEFDGIIRKKLEVRG